jgi:hypothetical protein
MRPLGVVDSATTVLRQAGAVRAATKPYWRLSSDTGYYLDSVFGFPERTLSLNSSWI